MPSVLEIEYQCIQCGDIPPEDEKGMVCKKCGGSIRGKGCAITGTRDSFGIKNEFKDNSTGKVIDNWKSWEKAGYRNPLETTRNLGVRKKIQNKIKQEKRKAK